MPRIQLATMLTTEVPTSTPLASDSPSASERLQLGLEDLLADLHYARRSGDLGRLALLAYCEVRRWARLAGHTFLAEHSSEFITQAPHASREQFLAQIDALIAELEQARVRRAA